MRELLYQAYLRFPRAFYDRHATGQVLSRATNDLYPIRYFIGWGLIQGIQSLMMIVAAGIVLVIVNPRLALYTAVAMPPITVLALRFARRVSPLSREVQERKGDVTEAADEAVVGIEMVQAFGREAEVRGRFGERAQAVRDTVLRQAGVEARHLPGLYYLPSLSIAAVVFFGGRQVIAGTLSIGEFVLFETLLLQLVWPLEALGWITNLAPAGARIGGPKLRVARGHRAAARARGAEARSARPARRAVRGGALRVRRRDGGAARPRPRHRAGRDRRRLRADRLGQDVAAQSSPPLLRSDRRARADRRRRHARRPHRRASRVGRARHAASGALLRAAAREPHDGPGGRGLGRGARRVRGRRRRRIRGRAARRLRHAHRRARDQPLGRPAPARGARAGARDETRASSCSTTRSLQSTRSPSGGS